MWCRTNGAAGLGLPPRSSGALTGGAAFSEGATFLHHLEAVAGVPYRKWVTLPRAVVGDDGAVGTRDVQYYGRDDVRWREDFDCVQEIGINYLRYGPPIHKTWLGPGKYDWEFTDLTFAELKKRDITPIVDLCHFGVPDWVGNFQKQ